MMDRLSDLVSRFMHDQRGSGLTLFAAGFVLLLGMAGLVVDTGFLYAVRGELQVTADAAALAAAKKLPDETTARATAISLAGKNMPVAKHGNVLTAADVITGNWDSNTRTFTPAGTPMNALQVTTRKSQTNGNPAGLYFARLMGFDAINMAASAVATSSSAPCIVALAPTGDEALEIEMAAGTMTLGCGVQVNSNDPQAIELDGSACLSAPYINVVGGYTGSCYTPTPVTGAPAMPDPLGSLPPPAYSGCDFAATVSISTSTTLNPGTYCGGIEITGGTVTFQPGMYVVDGVGLQLTGTGTSRAAT